MTKAKKTATKTKRKSRRSTGRRSQGVGLTDYQHQLVNPCAAPMMSPYGGERGIVERFVFDYTLGAATHTCGYTFLTPASNTYGSFTNTTPASVGTTTSAAAFANTFMVGTVQKVRPIACCLELMPASLSITNITGELAMGVVDASNFLQGTVATVDAIFTLMNERTVIEKKDYEIKWFPGVADNLYNTRTASGGNFVAAEPSSQNQIVIAWRGVPASTLLSFRATTIMEWTPINGLGLAANTTPGRELDWKNQSADLHEKHSNWWNPHSRSQSFADSYRHAANSNPKTKKLYGYLTDYRARFHDVYNALSNQ